MKKMLYYTTKDMTGSEVGINNKIREQIGYFEKNGYAVDAVYRRNEKELVISRKGTEHVLKTLEMRPYKVFSNAILHRFVRKRHYDCVFIRYVYCDFEFMKLLKILRMNCGRIVIEIPTYPYDAELKDNAEHRIQLFLDVLHREHMRKYVDRIITFSDDEEIFGIPTVRTMNGLNFDHASVSVRNEQYRDKINLIAVAAHALWHGYDRILAGMADYYKNGGERDILFHVVGEGPELERYQQMVRENALEDHVIFYGTLRGEALDRVYDNCDLAAEAFGAHRKGIRKSSSLKSRDYAAKGLPVVSGMDIDIFENPPLSEYLLKVSYDDSPVDMNAIILFYDRIYGSAPRGEIAGRIRDAAASVCSLDSVLRPVLEALEGSDRGDNADGAPERFQ